MNTKLSLICGLLAMAIALTVLSVSDSASAASSAAGSTVAGSQQLLVRVWADGASYGMRGQELPISQKQADGMALPALQKAGWRIVSVSAAKPMGKDAEKHPALVLLEK